MPKRSIGMILPLVLALASVLPAILRAQTAQPRSQPQSVEEIKIDKWNSLPLRGRDYAGLKSAPAPRRDLTGIWDATGDRSNIPPPGIQINGAHEHPAILPGNRTPPGGAPDERNIPNPLPYTPLGEATLESHKPIGQGIRAVPAELGNDPVNLCDPPGFPRMELNEFRGLEIVQLPDHVLILNQNDRTWRTIWTDGRELPADPEPRWYGYSVGKWVDDYTFVVQTVGLTEKTWLDNQGRPHSGELKVEERFHRIDNDHMELTVAINDPQMYTGPWQGLNKFPLRRQPRGFDIREMYCSPSDFAQYEKDTGDSVDVPSGPSSAAPAQTEPATEAADAAAIKQVLAAYSDAWNRRDAHALAMLFTEDADYTNVNGGNTHGSKAIEEMFVRLLTGTGMFRASHRTDTAQRIRFLSPGVASLDDYWVVEGALPERPHREGLYHWVLVKQNGRWLTAVHHATNFTPRPAAPARDGR
jgi:uncharacterized protein (TIGR02246 family)